MHIFKQILVGKKKFMLAGAVLLLGLFFVGTSAHADSTKDKIISIFDRGSEKVIVTRADTVSQALDQAKLTLDPRDSVEPARDTKLIASRYKINIYRARPVMIVDGAAHVKVMTARQSAAGMLEDASMTLYPEDTTVEQQSGDLLTSGGVSTQLIVTRATPLNLRLYGQETAVRTQAKTVGELLTQKEIKLAGSDALSVSASTPITSGMNVEIWREGKQTVNQTEDVPFTTQRVLDYDHDLGYTQVQTAGVVGKRTVTYEIEMRNGIEVSRTEIQSVVTQQPSAETIIVGMKQKVGNPAENKILGHQMMLNAGFDESQWTCLDSLWTHESGWDQYKANKGGSGAYGIPQALPGSKMGAGWQDNASVQIGWGLGYIKGRYGTPCGAWSAWQSKGWY